MANSPPVIRGGKLTLNLITGKVAWGSRKVSLSQCECYLLYVLMRNAGRTVSSQEIFKEVWKKEDFNIDLLRSYIKRIRKKLNDDPAKIILNDHGEGYRFISPA